jgi:L-fuculose-phosphate aldolase
MKESIDIASQIAMFGRKVVSSRLTSSRFGNISARIDDSIFITKTGSMLDELDESLIVTVGLQPCTEADAEASCETPVHRAVYGTSEAMAVIHTHSPYAVALSLLMDRIRPVDSEGLAFLGEMPVVDGHFGSGELAHSVSAALLEHRATVAKGHGVFAAGKSLEDAYTVACMAEHCSMVLYLVEAYKRSGRQG